MAVVARPDLLYGHRHTLSPLSKCNFFVIEFLLQCSEFHYVVVIIVIVSFRVALRLLRQLAIGPGIQGAAKKSNPLSYFANF